MTDPAHVTDLHQVVQLRFNSGAATLFAIYLYMLPDGVSG
jgi:hypothetical protein